MFSFIRSNLSANVFASAVSASTRCVSEPAFS